jgi:hypothetical protein
VVVLATVTGVSTARAALASLVEENRGVDSHICLLRQL